MHGPGFDDLTRTFSDLRSRRGLARLLLGAALGGAPTLLALDDAEAKRGKHRQRRKRRDHRSRDHHSQANDSAQADKKKGKKKACPPCKKRKKGKCKGKLPDGTACPGGRCRAGSCVPTTAPPVCTPACGGRVCGGDDGCGKSCGDCPDGLKCQDGECVLDCGSGLTDCSGTCVDLQTDVDHCGACATACSFLHASAICQNGECELGECEGDWRNCDGNSATGCETNVQESDTHCGECGTACASGQRCSGGACICDQSLCRAASGCCHAETCTPTDFQQDPQNCGDCAVVCHFAHASAVCDLGTCALGTCDEGWDTCDGDPENGCETNLLHDLSHCGACGTACDRATQLCNGNGACVACDVCASGCSFDTIHAAITAAAPGEMIRVCAGTWVLSSTLVVEKDLILVGAGDDETILDGNDTVRVLTIGGSGLVDTPIVAVRNLTITRGLATGIPENNWGGGVFNHGTLTLSNVRVTGNFADFAGGIRNRGSLDLVDCRVTDNTTKFGGAGIGNSGSAGSGTLTLIRSSVQDNTVGWDHSSGSGGGINNYLGTVTIEESQVTGNTAHSGGGIFNQGQGDVSSATLTLKAGSRVTNNFGYLGGGVQNDVGTVTMEAGSRVSGNTAEAGGGIRNDGRLRLEVGSKVTSNTAQIFGGGIENSHFSDHAVVTLAAPDIVTDNHLANGASVSNCFPVDTIPNCLG